MAFITKVAYNMDMVKVANVTKIYGGNTKSALKRGLQTTLHLPRKLHKMSDFIMIQKNPNLTPLKNTCQYFGKFMQNLYIKFYCP